MLAPLPLKGELKYGTSSLWGQGVKCRATKVIKKRTNNYMINIKHKKTLAFAKGFL
jgi:hypothetical protein